MPIKEIIAFGMLSIAAVGVSGGPLKFKERLLKAQVQILKDVGRTSNWGDPLIWHVSPKKSLKAVKKAPKALN